MFAVFNGDGIVWVTCFVVGYLFYAYWKAKLGLDDKQMLILMGSHLLLGALLGSSPALFPWLKKLWGWLGMSDSSYL